MTTLGFLVFALLVLLVLALPRRYAIIPILASACFLTYGQGLTVAGWNLYAHRLIIIIGCLRALVKREWLPGGLGPLDRAMLVMLAVMSVATLFHDPIGASFGGNLNYVGYYFVCRVFLPDLETVKRAFLVLGLFMIPLALEMAGEASGNANAFASFGGVNEYATQRAGRPRAQGPFMHAILAGVFAASILLPNIGLWRTSRLWVGLSLASCLAAVFFSGSSTPLVTAMVGAMLVALWKWRSRVPLFCKLAVVALIGLEFVMKAHVWYLLGRVDLVGGSTGWHRAELIAQAFSHLGEWWLYGTDYTRHWMPYGVAFSDQHTDITNVYLFMGISGGLPLMIVFIALIWISLRTGWKSLQILEARGSPDVFFFWCLGCTLATLGFIFLTVSLFDQSALLFCLLLASMAAIERFAGAALPAPGARQQASSDPSDV